MTKNPETQSGIGGATAPSPSAPQGTEREKPIKSDMECLFCGADCAIFLYYPKKQQAGFFCPACRQYIIFVELDAVNKAISGKKGEDA